MDKKVGTISNIICDRGFGFIEEEDGSNVFFHASAFPPGEFEELNKGDVVEFEPADTPKGPKAINIVVMESAL